MKEKPFGMRNILIRTLCAAYIGAAGFTPLFADKRAADRDWVDRRIDNAIADAIRNIPGIAEGNEFLSLLEGKSDRVVFTGPASISNIPDAVSLSFEVTRCTNVALMVMSSSSPCVPSNTVFAWNVNTGRFENPTNTTMPYIERMVKKTVSVVTNMEMVVKTVTNTTERLVAHAADGATYMMGATSRLYHMHNTTNFFDKFSFILVTVPDATRDAILTAGGVLSARSNAHRKRGVLGATEIPVVYDFDDSLWDVWESISIGTIEWIGADGKHHVFYGNNRTITFNMADFAGELDPANLVSSVWFRQLKRWGVTDGNAFLTDEYGNTMTLGEFMSLTAFKDAAAILYQAYLNARKPISHKHVYMKGYCVCEYARLGIPDELTEGYVVYCTDKNEYHGMDYSTPGDENSCIICVCNQDGLPGCGKKDLPGSKHPPSKTKCGCDCGLYTEETEYLQYHTNAKPGEYGGSCWCHCGSYHVNKEESACEDCCKWCGKKMDDSGEDGTHTQSETKCRSCKCADESAPYGVSNASDADMEELGWHHRQKPEEERSSCGCQCGTITYESDGDKKDFHYMRGGNVTDSGSESACWCYCGHRHEAIQKPDEADWCQDVCYCCGDKKGSRFGAEVSFDNALVEGDVSKHRRIDDACGCKCGAIVCNASSCSEFATSKDMHYVADGDCTCSCAGKYHVKVESEFCPKVCGVCHKKSKTGPLGFDVVDDETGSADHDPDESNCGCQCYNNGGESGGYGYGGFITFDILRFHQRENGSCRCKCNGSAFHWPITDGSCDAVCANCGYASEDSSDSEGEECQKRREATINDHTPHESKCGCKCQDNDGRRRGAPGDGAYSGVFEITKYDSGDAYVAFHQIRKDDLHCTCKCGNVHHAEWEHKTCGAYEWDQCTEIDTHIKDGTTEAHEYADGYLNDAVHYCKCSKKRTQAHVKVPGTQRTEPGWIITPKSCSVPGCGWTAEDKTPCPHSWGEWRVSYQTSLIVTYVRSCNVCGAVETDTKYLPDLQMCDTNNNVHIPESDVCGCKCGKYGQNTEASPDIGLHKWADTEDANGVQICLCKCGRYHVQRSASTYMSNLGKVCGSICAYCKNKSGTGLDVGKADDALHTPCTASDGHCGCKCGYLTADGTSLEKFHIRKAGTCRCLGSDGTGGAWHFRMPRSDGKCQKICSCTSEFGGEHCVANSEKEPITPKLASVTDHTKVSGSMCGCECRKYYHTNWQSWINLANFHNSDPNHCGCFCGHASESQIDPYHKRLNDSYCECMCSEHKVISHVWDVGHCKCNCQYHDKQHQKINSGKCTAVCHGECGEASLQSKKMSHTPHENQCGCECRNFLGPSYPDTDSFHKLTGGNCMCDCGTRHIGFVGKNGCPLVCDVCGMNYERTASGSSIQSFGNRCVCGCGQYSRSHVWSDPPAKTLINTYTCETCEETIRVYRYTIHCVRDCDASDSWTGEEGHDPEDHEEPGGDAPPPSPTTCEEELKDGTICGTEYTGDQCPNRENHKNYHSGDDGGSSGDGGLDDILYGDN